MITFEHVKPIRKEIRKFNADTLLSLAIQKLHELRDMPIDQIRSWQPWHLMTLVKWLLLFGDFVPSKRTATLSDLAGLHNMIHRLNDQARLPSEFSSIYVFLKSMAFQQFWYQKKTGAADFGRQLLMFQEMPSASSLAAMFQENVGLSPRTFIELAFSVAATFMGSSEIFIRESYFGPLERVFSSEAVRAFAARLSLGLHSARAFLKTEDQRIKDYDAKMYEQSPLRRKPLLKINDRFYCYSLKVLLDGLSTILYDILKETITEKFTREFGKVFEKYLRLGLEYGGVEFLSESELQQRYPGGKVVDFLLPQADGAILIEAKAVELSPWAQVSPDVRVIGNHLRGSVIKAIIQGLVIVNRIRRGASNITEWAQTNFLLVVTFNDLFIGSGTDFIVGSIKEQIENFARDNDLDCALLPSENVFFLSIGEFEYLVELCKSRKIVLLKTLREAVAANRVGSTKKFSFWQHLYGQFGGVSEPEFVREPFTRMASELSVKVGH